MLSQPKTLKSDLVIKMASMMSTIGGFFTRNADKHLANATSSEMGSPFTTLANGHMFSFWSCHPN
jgi:hypothetical protein